MPRFTALLRGVNVGRAKRVSMGELRTLLEQRGFQDVSTVLNSGNVVFTSSGSSAAAHAGRIQDLILSELRVTTDVLVISSQTLSSIAAENPFFDVATDPSRLLVAFPSDARALKSLEALSPLVVPSERFALGRHAAFLWLPPGILQSRAAKALLRHAGEGVVTTRNWATVSKLLVLVR